MNILLISQCNKRALVETRRVLDQFAERKGERTWQTAITLQGLQTLRKMLKKSARRNTAVSCHRIGGKNYSELLWIVGNANKFNTEGTIPTNFTRRDVLKMDDENQWHTATVIALLSAIAALFHDFGKANVLFQKKLKTGKRTTEPYRHEWVSLRMFEAFVRSEPDEQWLRRLANVSSEDEDELSQLPENLRDHPDPDIVRHSPFKSLPPLAQAVGWLILTHHRLPQTPKKKTRGPLKRIADFLSCDLQPDWNSSRERWVKGEWKEWAGADKEVGQVWTFLATPLKSRTWCKKARNIAEQLQKHPGILDSHLDNDFVMHVARMTLMLADHYYSSLDKADAHSKPEYGDSRYKVYANTGKDRKVKQQLDEHLVGVYKHSLWIMRILPGLRNTLPALGRHAAFKKRTQDGRFRWQNKAYDLAYSLKDKAQEGGFFGVNMASTGCGKTFANARIMYALADEKRGCRFSVALGLRTLTLQTGDAFRQRMRLDEDDMAVMIGSAAVRKLHEDHVAEKEKEEQEKPDRFTGSESAEALDDDYRVIYDEALADTALKRWLKASPEADRMVGVPVLVSTIDHLMPATEGTRGGRQIAPMLRLLTSDLVIDEPDDFGLDDLKALTRLVHWAGMLGSKVVLSSATLSPALVTGLFQAYQVGRTIYNKNCGNPNQETVCCAWFDETKAEHADIANAEGFRQQHSAFAKDRAAHLAHLRVESPKRKAEIVPLTGSDLKEQHALDELSSAISAGIHRLHHDHCQEDPKTKKKISVGLVRMANINPLVAVAQRLLQTTPPGDTTIHYCVYHGRFPLIVRSEIERVLDTVLTRKDGKDSEVWRSSVIQEAIARADTTNHIFVVIASPVAEIGRDHDYDWAVVEPSSMRSLVQIGGRVLRHRDRIPETVNMLLLSKNYRGLTGQRPAFYRPGFEPDKKDRRLTEYDLAEILCEDQYAVTDSRPCIVPRENFDSTKNLADMEHRETELAFSSSNQREPYALQWIRSRATLTGELQKCTPFRQSYKEDDYFLHLEEGAEKPKFRKWHGDGPYKEAKDCDEIIPDELSSIGSGNRIWGNVAYSDALNRLAQKKDKDVEELGKTYGTFSLWPAKIGWPWRYTPELGFYEPMKK